MFLFQLIILVTTKGTRGFPGGASVKEPACQCRRCKRRRFEVWVGAEGGRSPGGRHGNPLQYSCLKNSTDRRAWRATVHRVTELDTSEAPEHERQGPRADFSARQNSVWSWSLGTRRVPSACPPPWCVQTNWSKLFWFLDLPIIGWWTKVLFSGTEQALHWKDTGIFSERHWVVWVTRQEAGLTSFLNEGCQKASLQPTLKSGYTKFIFTSINLIEN